MLPGHAQPRAGSTRADEALRYPSSHGPPDSRTIPPNTRAGPCTNQSSAFELNKEIEVARRGGFASRCGAEQAEAAHAKAPDLVSLLSQCFQD